MKGPELTILDCSARLGMAALLGIAIGFERQWRQRAAGLHTSSLVSIGAALFAVLDLIIGAGDTTRIVAGVVTGVGFIGGGAILRSGLNVSGLNTAATMWATAAVGALAGFGLFPQAAAGAAGIICVNLLLQPIADAIDVRARRRQASETVYKLTLVCNSQSQPAISAAVLDALSSSPLSLQSLTRHYAEDENVELQAAIYAPLPEDAVIEGLSTKLLSLPGVRSADWQSASP